MPKKKSSKLKNMTNEERILYLEQKMLAEQEERKKKEDLMQQMLRAKMLKETKFTRNNMNRINYQWMFIMRDMKGRELERDIEIISQTFERIIDRKDSVIKALLKDLAESEEQFCKAIRSYFERTDFLIDVHSSEIGLMQKKYLEDLEVIKLEFDKERDFIVSSHVNEMDELATIIYGMEKVFLDQESEANIEYLSLRDDIKIRNLEDKQQLRLSLEIRVTDLWNQFNQVMQTYEENNGQRKRSFEELREKDEKSAKEIDMQMRKINGLLEKIEHHKHKINSHAQHSTESNNSLKMKRDEMNEHFQELKLELKKLQNEMRNDLTKLILRTSETVKILEKKKEKAKQILTFAEMCRKLETEEEKILPFYKNNLTEEETKELEDALNEYPDTTIIAEMKEFAKLDNFWKHYSKAFLDKLSLEKEKQMLKTENNQLRLILKQYLDGISVNENVLSQVNPLLIVNNRTNVRFSSYLNRVGLSRASSKVNVPDSYHKVVIEAKNHIKNTI